MVKSFFIGCLIIIIVVQGRLTYILKSAKVNGNIFKFCW